MRPVLLALMLLVSACSKPSAPAHADEMKLAPPSPIQRCINLGGGLEAPHEGDWGYTVRQEDLERISEAGFDTIRLPVKWSAHAAARKPYTIEPAFLARVQQIAGWADEAGLQIIIDIHHYDELMDDPDGERERLGALWRQIAEAFEDAPQSVIFELINEPRDGMTVRKTDAINRELLSIVRAGHPDRWVVVGSAGWGGLDALLKSRPPEDERIILTFHSYEPYNFTHQGAFFATNPPPVGTRWGTRDDLASMQLAGDLAAEFAVQQDRPMLLGEFGVYEEVPLDQRVNWTRAMRETAEARQIGWCYWDYATTFKLYNLEQETWIRSLLAALMDD